MESALQLAEKRTISGIFNLHLEVCKTDEVQVSAGGATRLFLRLR